MKKIIQPKKLIIQFFYKQTFDFILFIVNVIVVNSNKIDLKLLVLAF
jgi:hypothetical protein